MATDINQLNQVYREELGRDIDSSGAETYKDMSVDELRSTLRGSQEYGFKQRHDSGEESDATWESFWHEYGSSLGLDMGGQWMDASGSLLDGLFMNDVAPEGATWVPTVEGGFDMANARSLFDQYQAQGMYQDEMALHMKGNHTYDVDRLVNAPMAKGQRWYDAGYGLTDEFGASHAGDLVLVKEGQNMYQDHYQDVSEYLGNLLPEGYVAYQDLGDQDGGTGLFGVIDDAFNTNIVDTYDAWMMNEGNNFVAGGGTMTALTMGSNIRDEGYQGQGDLVGVNQEEVATTNDAVEKIALAVASIFTAGSAWYVGAAVAAGGTAGIQGGKKISGSQAERDRQSWSDVAENAAVAGVAGGLGGSSAGLVNAAHAKSKGADWNEVGAMAAVSLFGNTSNAWVNAAVAGGANYAVTGDATQAGMAAGFSVAGSYAGNEYQTKGKIGVSLAESMYSSSTIDRSDFATKAEYDAAVSNAQWGTAISAASAIGTSAAGATTNKTSFSGKPSDMFGATGDALKPGSLFGPSIYDEYASDEYGTRKPWFNPGSDYKYGTKGNLWKKDSSAKDGWAQVAVATQV